MGLDKEESSDTFRLIKDNITYSTAEMLKASLNKFLNSVAKKESIVLEKDSKCLLADKFAELIEVLHKTTDKRVVVLIDEYDKPMIDSLNKEKGIHEEIKESLHNFYQVIKAEYEHIEFVLLTGVSQFSGLSIFSGLNNLNNITMNSKYGAICGYTQEELERDFKEHIEYTAKELKMTEEKLLSEIKRWYNGYSWDGEVLVYNPFSTLLFFDNKRFAGHWFETEMPTFLIEEIKKKEDVEKFVEEQRVMDSTLRDSSREIETVSLLFQTGYLTIKKEEYVERTIWYTLDFPNYEVKEAFLSSLMKEYTLKKAEEIKGINKKIEESLVEKDGERLGRSLEELLANIPYDLHTKRESYYHSLFLLANEDEWI